MKFLAFFVFLYAITVNMAVAQPSVVKSSSDYTEEEKDRLGRLADALCTTMYDSSSDIRNVVFPTIQKFMILFKIHSNPTKADAVKFLNANKHELISRNAGRHFMTCAIESRVATTLLMRTFSIDIKDLKDENGEKVSIDFNGIYFNEQGEPQTLMNYMQNSMKSNRFTFETKVQFKRVASYIYHANGARRFHKLELTDAEKARFSPK